MNAYDISDIAPFRMIGNLYFVGSRAVSIHLIDTGEGLIMIDTGYPYMRQRTLENIRALGFDPTDIRIILHSHGHYDHIGSTVEFKRISGAKTYISRIDEDIVSGKLNLSWADELGYDRLPPFNCDVLIDDGDVISLGETRIKCVLAPGHTNGTLAIFANISDGEKRYTAAMHGGVGMNSMSREFLSKHGLDLSIRDVFREGLHRLADERIDIVMGNHPDQNDTEGKLKRLLSGDRLACVDTEEWSRFMQACEKRLDDMLREEAKR